MESEEVRTVRLFNEAINRHDVESLCSLMTKDHTFIDSGGAVTRGVNTMKDGWKDFFRRFPDYRNEKSGLSEKKPKTGGWSPKVVAIWDWKTRIPQTYPSEVFYGKVQGGDAVLMEMQHFRYVHYPDAFQPVSELDPLAQQVYDLIGPGAKGIGFKALFKLEYSMSQARKLASKEPDRFEVGSTGWVTTRFTAEKPLPKSIWEKWLQESYHICCGSSKGNKAVKKKSAKKVARKKPTAARKNSARKTARSKKSS